MQYRRDFCSEDCADEYFDKQQGQEAKEDEKCQRMQSLTLSLT